MRKTLEKCWEQNIDIPQLFIDCQAEYDTPWRKKYGVKCINYVSPAKIVILYVVEL